MPHQDEVLQAAGDVGGSLSVRKETPDPLKNPTSTRANQRISFFSNNHSSLGKAPKHNFKPSATKPPQKLELSLVASRNLGLTRGVIHTSHVPSNLKQFMSLTHGRNSQFKVSPRGILHNRSVNEQPVRRKQVTNFLSLL